VQLRSVDVIGNTRLVSQSCNFYSLSVIGLGWLRSTVVERRSPVGELSLSHARLAADACVTAAAGKPSTTVISANQANSAFHLLRSNSELESDVCYSVWMAPSGES